ncbi:benzoate 4-monooxygenase cytochrome p450 [Diaporthe amygdali]|uniref:benzoate 4-monooxygenase cytochrome p450 n=1 Tax=Phomopsis amygdali TaxID=1214568 RepID=UPI0022FE909A|nr:benzoate 4-monooxygenase cytochrome p450 [Diaporthe amygdali]KAJ0125007.1 benzoate 4-monooxygenase cytochrome p450 [Diaporthe amygdali]
MFNTGFAVLIASLAIYALGKTIYNVFFHPLARVPGPKLAAITRLWFFATDFSGDSSARILKWHEAYGPVIRVAPNELSIFDIDAYLSELYAQNTDFTKAPYFYDAFNNPEGTVFSQLDKAAHSAEKRLMSHAFSRRNIVGMQHQLYDHVHKWIDNLRTHARAQKPIPLSRAAQCLTLDNVSFFSYGGTEGALDSEDFHNELLEQFEAFPKLGSTIGWDRFISQKGRGETNGMILFESMLERARKNNVHIDRDRGIANGSLMLVAGTGTTAAARIYQLTKQPELWLELKRQLRAAIPEDNTEPDVTELEKVPLMEAVAKDPQWYYCRDPNVYYEPELFEPKRWLVDDANALHAMNRNLVVFSNGSRNCIGQNLAIIELKLTLSQVVLNFEPGETKDPELEYEEYVGLTEPKGLVEITLRESP